MRFVTPHYKKELLLKLQRIHQENRSVDEYFKDSEITLTKINMHESEESKITRCLSGLRREIQNVVELYEYTSLEKLVHLAIKVESQILKKKYFKNTHNDGFYKSSWKDKINFKIKIFLPISLENPPPQHKICKDNPSPSSTKSSTKTSSKKCFKCLGFGHIVSNCSNKRTMMVKRGIIVSDHNS